MAIKTHVPEGITVLFEAPQRWGKTLGGVIWALDAYQTGRTVFSNIQLGFPHEPLDFNDMALEDGSSKYWNGHIFIDEWNFFFDGRGSMKKKNVEFSAFLLQQKKQGCNITGTTHDLMNMDVRLRNNYDYLVSPSVTPKYPEVPQFIKLDIVNGPLREHFRRTLVLDCRPFLGLYDSFAVYNPFKASDTPKPKKPRPTRPTVEL